MAVERLTPSSDGVFVVDVEELDRIDVEGRSIYWQLGPGFLATYRLEFERQDRAQVLVRVSVKPKQYRSRR
jgi:hypothetical protein